MGGMGERETWTTEEFGAAHEGAIGVLLDNGTVPEPVFFDVNSGPGGRSVSHWSVYDGRRGHGPRAAALRAVCSCGWAGSERPVDWETIGEQSLDEAELEDPDLCAQDWDAHTDDVSRSAIPMPETITAVLTQLEEEIDRLTTDSPLAALRASRHVEVTATRVGYWAAREVRRSTPPEEAAAALGLNEDATRALLARLGGWSPYN